MQLSWDLHIHPGPASAGRWGDGRRILDAAAAVGVSGFVWKDHTRRIEAEAAGLPGGGPRCLASLVLNTWSRPEDVFESLAAGVRWFWGPTRDSQQQLGWELALPSWWPEAREMFLASEHPLVLATGHLGSKGRRELAETAAERTSLLCSVTHSLYLPDDELADLVSLRCAFEHDLYTASFPIATRPERELSRSLERVFDLGGLAYLTSDAGQLEVGNPFAFAEEALGALGKESSTAIVELAARANPAQVAAHLGEKGGTT
jgi:hypothetical protein